MLTTVAVLELTILYAGTFIFLGAREAIVVMTGRASADPDKAIHLTMAGAFLTFAVSGVALSISALNS